MNKTIPKKKNYALPLIIVLCLVGVGAFLFSRFGGIPLGGFRAAPSVIPDLSDRELTLYYVPGGSGEKRELTITDVSVLNELQAAWSEAELMPVIAIGGKPVYQTDRFELKHIYTMLRIMKGVVGTRPAIGLLEYDGRVQTWIFRGEEQYAAINALLTRYVTEHRP